MHLQTRSVFTGVDDASYFDFVRGVLFMSELRKAAQALVDRWDTPLWKEAPHTGTFIDALRAALAQPEPEPLTDDEIKCIKPVCADFVSFRAGVRQAEREHGIGFYS